MSNGVHHRGKSLPFDGHFFINTLQSAERDGLAMTIRKITEKDKSDLYELIDVIEENLPDERFWLPMKETARAHFFDPDWTEFYGAFDGDRLAGAAALFYNEYEFGESLEHLAETGFDVSKRNVAELGRAMVHPDYRGNGLLVEIASHLLQLAREKGVDLLIATVYPENMPSQMSLKRLGMVKRTTYRKTDGFVRDILTLDLR